MDHLDFLIWMLAFPLIEDLSDYMSFKCRKKEKEYSKDVTALASFFNFFVWFFVGYHLF